MVARGCLYCGVRAQTIGAGQVEQLGGRRNAARQIWSLRRSSPQALGGQPSPKILIGHLCVVCNDAVVAVGTLGPTSLERALVAHLAPQGIGKLGYDNFSLSGLIGWGVISATSDVPPNSEPFAHLGDLDELRRRLSAALHV